MSEAIAVLLGTYSDIHKDLYGIRPSLAGMTDMSESEIEAEIEALVAPQKREIEVFMAWGAPDQATALRWMDQVYEC